MRIWSALRVLPAFLVACGSASDLTLTASISDESLRVTDAAFGSSLSGSFRLRLELGSEASGSTQVTPGKFEIQTEAGQFVVDLRDAEMDPELPIALNQGESKQVLFTLPSVSVDRDQACPGPVRIVGSVMDSLKGGSVPVRSAAILPDCG